jgi:hypothetical protein
MPLDNKARARRAAASLRAYASASRVGFRINDERITDLIIDLLHLAHATGTPPDTVARLAQFAHLQYLSERSVAHTPPAVPLEYNPESRVQ